MVNIWNQNLTKRGFITKPDDDKSTYHVSQVEYMERVCDVEIILPYGFYSNAPKDSMVVIWNVQGMEENRVGLAYKPDDRYKMLKPGEVALGSPQAKTKIFFDSDGGIMVTGKNNASIKIDKDGNISISTQGNFNLNATGDVIIQGATIQLNGNSLPLSSDRTVKTN